MCACGIVLIDAFLLRVHTYARPSALSLCSHACAGTRFNQKCKRAATVVNTKHFSSALCALSMQQPAFLNVRARCVFECIRPCHCTAQCLRLCKAIDAKAAAPPGCAHAGLCSLMRSLFACTLMHALPRCQCVYMPVLVCVSLKHANTRLPLSTLSTSRLRTAHTCKLLLRRQCRLHVWCVLLCSCLRCYA